MARGRPGLPGPRHLPARLPGQRQGARPAEADSGASQEELAALCRQAPNVRAHVDGREVVKEVVVPGKLVNLVVR